MTHGNAGEQHVSSCKWLLGRIPKVSFLSHLKACRTQEARLAELRMIALEYQSRCFKVNVPVANCDLREGWDSEMTAVHSLLDALGCRGSAATMASLDLEDLSPRRGRKTFSASPTPILDV